MIFLQGLRENWGQKLLQRKVRKNIRVKTYNNFDSAHTVGILFDASRDADFAEVKKLVASLIKASKRVDALGLLPTAKQIVPRTEVVGISFFAADDCTFFRFPKGANALQFVSQKFDILLNVCPGTSLATDYVVAMSKAKFKVSTKLGDEAYADFILQFATGNAPDGKPSSAPGAGQIIATMKQYLSNIAKA